MLCLYQPFQVLSWKEDGGGRKMCSARPSWMSITPITLGYKDRLYRVRLDEMNDILKVLNIFSISLAPS